MCGVGGLVWQCFYSESTLRFVMHIYMRRSSRSFFSRAVVCDREVRLAARYAFSPSRTRRILLFYLYLCAWRGVIWPAGV